MSAAVRHPWSWFETAWAGSAVHSDLAGDAFRRVDVQRLDEQLPDS